MKKKLCCILLAAGMLTATITAAGTGNTPGDVNGDTSLNGFDLALMKRALSENTLPANADVDNSSTLSQDDVQQMQDYLLGRIDYFDAGLSADCIRLSSTAVAESGRAADDAFMAAQMDFTLNLFKNTVQEENTLVSPLSVMLALSMTANGADSRTLEEMESVLGGMGIAELNEYLAYHVNQLDSNESCSLHLANSIWYKDDEKLKIHEDFLNVNSAFYDAEIYKAPFDDRTMTDINSWVKKHTDGMIPRLLDKPLNPDDMAVLVNALAFDAKWQDVYCEYDVSTETFTAADGTAQEVQMMHSTEHIFYDFGNAVGFAKDYCGNYQFVAILPEEGMPINDWIAQADAAILLEILSTSGEYATVVASIPQFSYDTSLDLNETLSEMGMPTAFNKFEADFSKMGTYDESYSLYIGKVIHKTHITVDTEGTRAAAVTGVIMDAPTCVAPDTLKYITLDRPFLYMIVDTNTNLPIFMGTVQSVS